MCERKRGTRKSRNPELLVHFDHIVYECDDRPVVIHTARGRQGDERQLCIHGPFVSSIGKDSSVSSARLSINGRECSSIDSIDSIDRGCGSWMWCPLGLPVDFCPDAPITHNGAWNGCVTGPLRHLRTPRNFAKVPKPTKMDKSSATTTPAADA